MQQGEACKGLLLCLLTICSLHQGELLQWSEGCSLPMEAARKQHGSGPLDGFGLIPTAIPSSFPNHTPPIDHRHLTYKSQHIKKRSFKRALKRAVINGGAWFKGQFLRPSDVGIPLAAEARPSQNEFKWQSPQSSLHKPQNRISVFQWNVDGLMKNQFDDLQFWMKQQLYDVAILTETRWSFTSEWSNDDWYFIHSGSSDDKAGGIMVMISTRLCRAHDVAWEVVISDRILHCRIHQPHKAIDIVAIYQFTRNQGGQNVSKRKQVWHSLDTLLKKLPHRNLLILAGDFNCSLPIIPRLVALDTFWNGQRRQRGTQHDDMHELSTILQMHHLVALNCWQSSLGPTLIPKFGDGSRIDYILTRLQTADSQAKLVTQFPHLPFIDSSKIHHHVPQLAHIAFSKFCGKRRPPQRLPATVVHQCKMAQHWCTPQWNNFVHDLNDQLCSLPHSPDLLDQISNKLFDATLKTFGTASTQVETPGALLVQSKWHHWSLARSFADVSMKNVFLSWFHFSKFSVQDRAHRRFAKQRRHARITEMLAEAKAAYKHHDSFRLYNVVKLLSPKQPRKRIHLRKQTGSFMNPVEETAEYCRFIAETWQGEPLHLDPIACTDVPFTCDELMYELARIPTKKAVAPPYAPAVTWRSQAPTLAALIYPLLRDWWCRDVPWIPQSWRDGWTTFLPKPNKNSTCVANLRVLALQAPIGKAVVKLLTRKARICSMTILRKIPQFAYLPGRSTFHALLRVEHHCRQVRGLMATQVYNVQTRRVGFPRLYHCGGLQILVDINRAFDAIPRHLLAEALNLLPIDPDIRTLLLRWHMDTHYIVSVNGDSKPVKVFSGVRQGCTAAPYLWAAIMNLLMHRCSSVIPQEWLLKNLSIFADDIHLCFLYHNDEEFQQSLRYCTLFFDCLMDMGLSVNSKKTSVIWYGAGKGYLKARQAHVVKHPRNGGSKHFVFATQNQKSFFPIVSKATSLGTCISYGNFEDLTMKMRLNASRANFNRLRLWLSKRHGVSHKMKLSIWRTCIVTCASYGIFYIGITDKGARQIGSMLMQQLRIMFGCPSHVTHQTDLEFLNFFHLEHPLAHLLRLQSRALERYQQHLQRTDPQDIIHQCDLTAWKQSIHTLTRQVTRVLTPSPTTSTPVADIDSQALQCEHCGCFFSSLAVLKTHRKRAHQIDDSTRYLYQYGRDSKGGVATCAHCNHRFTRWRALQIHIECRRCPEFIKKFPPENPPTPCEAMAEPHTPPPPDEKADSPVAPPEVDDPPLEVMQTRFHALVHEADFDSLREDRELCQYVSSHCIECSRIFSVVQELNQHIRREHHDKAVGTVNLGIQLSGQYANSSPCAFCGRSFSRSHICPVWIQVAMIQCELICNSAQTKLYRQILCSTIFDIQVLFQIPVYKRIHIYI